MEFQYYIAFENNNTIISNVENGDFKNYRLGTLMLNYLDQDWASYLRDLDSLQNYIWEYDVDLDMKVSDALKNAVEPPYIKLAKSQYSMWNQIKDGDDDNILYLLFSSAGILSEIMDDNYSDMLKASRLIESKFGNYNEARKKSDFSYEKIRELKSLYEESYNMFMPQISKTMEWELILSLCNEEYPERSEKIKYIDTIQRPFIEATLEIIEAFRNQIEHLQQIKNDIFYIIEHVLDMEKTDDIQSDVALLKKMEDNNELKELDADKLIGSLKLRRIMINESGLSLMKTFYASTDIASLVFLELEEICEKNIKLRKCQNCQRYFIPMKRNVIYCDRIFSNGKTCKMFGPGNIYRKKNSDDETYAIYNKERNKRFMSQKRETNPVLKDKKSKAYKTWMVNVADLRQRYYEGKISIDYSKYVVTTLPRE